MHLEWKLYYLVHVLLVDDIITVSTCMEKCRGAAAVCAGGADYWGRDRVDSACVRTELGVGIAGRENGIESDTDTMEDWESRRQKAVCSFCRFQLNVFRMSEISSLS